MIDDATEQFERVLEIDRILVVLGVLWKRKQRRRLGELVTELAMDASGSDAWSPRFLPDAELEKRLRVALEREPRHDAMPEASHE
jgi:hypothetical protein